MDQIIKIKEHIEKEIIRETENQKKALDENLVLKTDEIRNISNYPELLDFAKGHYHRDFEKQHLLILFVFENLFNGLEIRSNEREVVAEKDGLKIVVSANTYIKKISFVYKSVNKPDKCRTVQQAVLFNENQEETPFWKAYKNYIENPNFLNLIKISKENIVRRKGFFNRILGYINSFLFFRNNDENKELCFEQESIYLKKLETYDKKNKIYEENQKKGIELIHGYIDIIDALAEKDWIIYFSGVETLDGQFSKEKRVIN